MSRVADLSPASLSNARSQFLAACFSGWTLHPTRPSLPAWPGDPIGTLPHSIEHLDSKQLQRQDTQIRPSWWAFAMPQPDPSAVNMLRLFTPSCSKCGASTSLAGIEPAPEPDHDLHTYLCVACGQAEVVKTKFR